jgi:hypothetical protein
MKTDDLVVKNFDYYEGIINKFLENNKLGINDDNFIGFKAIVGSEYDEMSIMLTGVFKDVFNEKSSDTAMRKGNEIKTLLHSVFPFTKNSRIKCNATSTISHYKKSLEWERKYLREF